MEPLGKVVNFSPKGSLIVKATNAPRRGQTVADRRQRPIGKVVRITGPVAAPYVIVAPFGELDSSMNRLLGTEVFLLPEREGNPPSEKRMSTRPYVGHSSRRSSDPRRYGGKEGGRRGQGRRH